MNLDDDVPSFATAFSPPPQNHFPNGGAGSARRSTGLSPPHPNATLSRPMAQPSRVFTFSALLSPSAPVAIHNVGRGSGGVTMSPPRKAHRRANSDNNTVSGLNSPRWVFTKPMEEMREVPRETIFHGEDDIDEFIAKFIDLDENYHTFFTFGENTSVGNKKNVSRRTRAGKEVATGKKRAASDARNAKRALANRLSTARAKERKAKYMAQLEEKARTLKMEASTLSAKCNDMEKANMAMEDENKKLMIRIEGMDQKARLRDTVIEELTGDFQRLMVASGEVCQNGSGYAINEPKHVPASQHQPVSSAASENPILNEQIQGQVDESWLSYLNRL